MEQQTMKLFVRLNATAADICLAQISVAVMVSSEQLKSQQRPA